MGRIIPLFPLRTVVFPNEKLPLHIFEERYKQLVNDCVRGNMNFGIPTYLDGELGYGTELNIDKIVRTYENGSLDIVCLGVRVFKIVKFFNPIPNKLYAGGEVEFFENEEDAIQEQQEKVLDLIHRMYRNIDMPMEAMEPDSFKSYVFAHKLGLNLQQEYKLLQLTKESERLDFIENHLKTVIPVLEQINETKKRIQLNGHFRNFDPLQF
ncbi:LON peptidase substrate-binding domain-containing protein [Galbibacter mesophilus]|uniref:LON peptidase substrate-binding domain-containing protein n=1 Tax=Galbibacter mesophilus TaxID=379069 RepID=UPI002044476E|nr:LON peptidase substrate-binding domain-containing protein [Galbibacter mesophilus]MCM5663166.1 LON peptidase substrate-binding domain-containing protein [Galbibacter mesophilus]